MNQYIRRIIGFCIQEETVDGLALCRMFNQAISERGFPRYLGTDNDPLFRFRRWKAQPRILEVEEIRRTPYVARSHLFIECTQGLMTTSPAKLAKIKKPTSERAKYY